MILVNLLLLLASSAHADSCTYETWDWDTVTKKAVNLRKVTKSKSEITQEERGETGGCSVCEEDQIEIRLPKLPHFKICKSVRDRMTRAIETAVRDGFPLTSVVGYRVGKSKGPINTSGLRTQFSNHSYGTAIDFNSEKNGLYDSCIQFSSSCRLVRGGEYKSGSPGTISKETPLYRAMRGEGFKWGGEIDGKQKDFMHFSLTGM